jgi:hypothetical protein
MADHNDLYKEAQRRYRELEKINARAEELGESYLSERKAAVEAWSEAVEAWERASRIHVTLSKVKRRRD